MYTLSADFGTSSVKTAIIDGNGTIIKTVTVPYQYRLRQGDMVELDVGEVEQAFEQTVREVRDYLPMVEDIGIDTFSPSVVFMDEKGMALYPIITHLDRRSRQYTQEIMRKFGKDSYRTITGTLPYAGGVTLTTLLWFKEHEPEVFKRTGKIGHLNTYLYKKLTGKWGMDPVNASITGMYETVKEGGWSREICDCFDIGDYLLPPVIPIEEAWADIRPKEAVRLGFHKNTQVNLGTQDVASAIAGAGLYKSGQILCISGSSEMISILTDKPLTRDDYYLRASGIKGLWQVFSITTGGFAIEWFQKEFYREMKKEEFFEAYLPALLEESFGSEGVTFLPYLTGDRQSLRKKRGTFSGLTLNTKREDLLCALIEGIQKPARRTYDECKQFIPLSGTITATGNLTENRAYLGIKSRLFDGVPITVVDQCPIKGNVRRRHRRGEEAI